VFVIIKTLQTMGSTKIKLNIKNTKNYIYLQAKQSIKDIKNIKFFRLTSILASF